MENPSLPHAVNDKRQAKVRYLATSKSISLVRRHSDPRHGSLNTSLPGNAQGFKKANHAETNPFNEHGLLCRNEHTLTIGKV
jgi:hypothetical protein